MLEVETNPSWGVIHLLDKKSDEISEGRIFRSGSGRVSDDSGKDWLSPHKRVTNTRQIGTR